MDVIYGIREMGQTRLLCLETVLNFYKKFFLRLMYSFFVCALG